MLYALTAYVARNGGVIALPGDLIDFIDVDDPALRALNIVVGVLEKTNNDVLDVFSNISGLCEVRGIGYSKRNIENPCKGLSKQSLPRTGWPQEQNVRLLQFYFVVFCGSVFAFRINSFVVVVHSYCEDFLRSLLSNHVLI